MPVADAVGVAAKSTPFGVMAFWREILTNLLSAEIAWQRSCRRLEAGHPDFFRPTMICPARAAARFARFIENGKAVCQRTD